MLIIKYEKQLSCTFSMWRCGFSSAELVHQKSEPVMLLSRVKLAGNVCIRDRHELLI